jgi:hypothetical protein
LHQQYLCWQPAKCRQQLPKFPNHRVSDRRLWPYFPASLQRGGDSQTAEEIIALVRDYVSSCQATLVLITHDAELARQCTDRVVRIHDGQIGNAQIGSEHPTA